MLNPVVAFTSGLGRRFRGVPLAPSLPATSRAFCTKLKSGIMAGKFVSSALSSYHCLVLSEFVSATRFAVVSLIMLADLHYLKYTRDLPR